MTPDEAGERAEETGGSLDPFDLEEDEDDGAPAPAGGLLGAIGQMTAAVLVVLLLVALFIAGAVALRWALP